MYRSEYVTEPGFAFHVAREVHEVQSAQPRVKGTVLGALHVGVDGAVETVAVAPKIRMVLAMLLVHADQVVPVQVLVRELWPEQPPATALRTLQTYILNCRKLLARVSGRPAASISQEVLATRSGGYILKGAHFQLDWLDFQRLTRLGSKCLAEGDTAEGIRLLDAALELWRGDALADVPLGPVLDSKRRLFEECRLDAIAMRAEAHIEAGLHQRAVTQLAAVTREHELHEGLHHQYVRALALGGRRAEALGVLRGLRVRLVNEVGIEPGAPLQDLQLAILNSEYGTT